MAPSGGFHAARRGSVPAAGARELAGLVLPAGEHVHSESGEVVGWLSELLAPAELVPLMRRLAAVFPQTGLWPVLAPEGGWVVEFVDHAVPQVSDAALVSLLQSVGGRWPVSELAAARPGPDLHPDCLSYEHVLTPALSTEDGALLEMGFLLVPVQRPADTLSALGWEGAVPWGIGTDAVTQLLRSWEDRFGAVLLSVTMDAVVLQVARPPRNERQRSLLRIEQYIIDPGQVDYVVTFEQCAPLTAGACWDLYWDQ